MSKVDIIVVGASAGGVQALKALIALLPADIGAAIFVVMHTSPTGPGLLPDILTGAGPLPVSHGHDGEKFENGRIYVAPPDHHLIVETPDRIRISCGPKENLSRPAIDPLFRSAALAFGARVAGVILTGNLDDGTAGLAAVKRRGGVSIVQDPTEAFAPSMPRSALRHISVDHCLPLAEMASLLASLARETASTIPRPMEPIPMADDLEFEVDAASLHKARDPAEILKLGDPSLFTCPDCHGTLVQLRELGLLRFRCHTGHAFTAESLVAALGASTEDTLWNALRVLEEKIMLLRHMADHSRESDETSATEKLLAEARMIEWRAHLVRHALLAEDATSVDKLEVLPRSRSY